MRITITSQNARIDNVIKQLEKRFEKSGQWVILHRLNAKRSNDRRPTKELPSVEGDHKNVKPSEVKLDDIVSDEGFQMKIVEIMNDKTERYCEHHESGVYVLRGEYIGGDLRKFNYFTNRINNGCDSGHLANFQGNDNAKTCIKV